jgi:hypothetical protein
MEHARILALLLVVTPLHACDEPDVETAAAPTAPTPTTEIEVTEIEDHGVALELALNRQHCANGISYGMSASATAGDDPMRIGEHGSARVWAGAFVEGVWSPGDGATVAGAADGGSEFFSMAPHEWRVEAKRIASTLPDEYRFELSWEHLVKLRADRSAQRTVTRRLIALRDDDRYVIDWVGLPADAAGCDPSLLIDLAVTREEPEALRNRVLRYEVWHVHTLPDGTEVTSHIDTKAKHAELAEFELDELRPALAEPYSFAGGELEVAMRPIGTLRGRVRSDGAIDLLIEAEIRTSLVDVGDPMTGWGAERGRHAFRLGAGQTLKLELPASSGTWTRTDGEHELVFEGADVLRDHADALLIRVTLG